MLARRELLVTTAFAILSILTASVCAAAPPPVSWGLFTDTRLPPCPDWEEPTGIVMTSETGFTVYPDASYTGFLYKHPRAIDGSTCDIEYIPDGEFLQLGTEVCTCEFEAEEDICITPYIPSDLCNQELGADLLNKLPSCLQSDTIVCAPGSLLEDDGLSDPVIMGSCGAGYLWLDFTITYNATFPFANGAMLYIGMASDGEDMQFDTWNIAPGSSTQPFSGCFKNDTAYLVEVRIWIPENGAADSCFPTAEEVDYFVRLGETENYVLAVSLNPELVPFSERFPCPK